MKKDVFLNINESKFFNIHSFDDLKFKVKDKYYGYIGIEKKVTL